MGLSVTQANAANSLAHYLDVTPAAHGRLITADEATEALTQLLDGAYKQIGAGLRGKDAAAIIAAIEQLREENAVYHLTEAGHQALAQPSGPPVGTVWADKSIASRRLKVLSVDDTHVTAAVSYSTDPATFAKARTTRIQAKYWRGRFTEVSDVAAE